eukprot:TRINITY_DN1334_c0_g1_i2.p1 TRINITY_DN1334_c0_g1~~TRINITY_DN1334_c0_g1_i2.p1  ORF type:complete len:336 (+),score=43.92 TRINITY_DN1334_c0_g1_i2:49-1008(+)
MASFLRECHVHALFEILMASNYFLTIPKKRASSDISLAKQIQQHIENEGYPLADFQEAINELDKLREDIRLVTEKRESVVDLYCRYFVMISSVGKRVPISEKNVRIKFYWYDIYHDSKTGAHSVAYEKACVLFNIGSLYSELAVQENLDTNEGIKNACKYFRLAAGVFDRLRKMLEDTPEAAISEDLSNDSLKMFSLLMIAQSQELFYMMAVKGDMKPSVITKLAAQTADNYHYVLELITTIKSHPKKWSSYIEMKRNTLKGLAYFYLGKESKVKFAYGEELGYYTAAMRHLKNASEKKSVFPELEAWFTNQFGVFHYS